MLTNPLSLSLPFLDMFRGHWLNYALAFAAIFIAFGLRKVFTDILLKKLAALSKTTRTEFDDLVLEAARSPFKAMFVVLGIWLATIALTTSFYGHAPTISESLYATSIKRFTGVLWILVVGWIGLNLCDVVGHALGKLTEKTETKLDDMLVPILRRSLKLFVGLIVFILLVQNLGYPIGALLAGFSIGGLAFALAAQDTLQNFFGSIMIFVDRPFQVGDWIEVGDLQGVVEEVGFRSTRVRTFAKTVITVPNSKVAHEAINNYSRMPKRRVTQTIGIGYTTEPDRVEAAVNTFRSILKEDERVDQDFWMVNFTEFGESSLDLFVYYFTKTTNWAVYMQTKQEINLKFMRALETLGIEIPFPTRTLYNRADQDPDPPPLAEVLKVLNPAGAAPPAPAGGADDDEDDADG
ncbi:MAG: mechanosensitive ion channel family protein [Planctomycetota bacterium]